MSQNIKTNKTITPDFLIELTTKLREKRLQFQLADNPWTRHKAILEGKEMKKQCDHYVGHAKTFLKNKHKDDIFTCMVLDILFVVP